MCLKEVAPLPKKRMQRHVLSSSNNKHEAVTELGSNLELVDLWLLSRDFKCVCMNVCVGKQHTRHCKLVFCNYATVAAERDVKLRMSIITDPGEDFPSGTWL